jgi:hypothetical protein
MSYPYIAHQSCLNCQSPIVIKQKREKDNQFCSRICYNQFRRKGKPIKINLIGSHNVCLQCEKIFIPTRNTKGMYCSYACSNGAKAVEHKLTCKCCAKEFIIKNIAEIKRGHYQYCSNECRKRKYRINEFFFDEINDRSAYWLGFIWATFKNNKYNKITLHSKEELFSRFLEALDSNYKTLKLSNGKSSLNITSLKILSRLSDLGLKDQLYLEMPEISLDFYPSFIRGYFDSNQGFKYKDNGKDVWVLHGRSSKLMRNMSDYLGAKLVIDKGEWVIIAFDLSKISGTPSLQSKWETA